MIHMNWMKSVKIRAQIGALVVIAAVGFVMVGGVFLLSDLKQIEVRNDLARANAQVALINEIRVGFLQERRAEKDFLLRSKLKYAERHADTGSKLLPVFDQLVESMNAPEQRAKITFLKGMFEAYLAQFRKVVETRTQIGLTSSEGLRGDLRKAVHTVEVQLQEIENSELAASLLMLRRHEKDFFLRRDPKYIKRLSEELNHFRSISNSVIEAEGQRDFVNDTIGLYATGFKNVSEMMLSEIGDQKAMSSLYAEAEPVLNETLAQIVSSFDEAAVVAETTRVQMDWIVGGVIAAMALLVIAMGFAAGRGISRPLTAMTLRMRELADGDDTVEIPSTDAQNEIGEMAQAVLIFKNNMIENRKLAAQQEEEQKARAERASRIESLNSNFDSQIGGMLQAVEGATGQLETTATSMSSIAAQTSGQATAVSAASEEASVNVQTVSSAADELSASIAEISRQVTKSAEVSDRAVQEAESTNSTIQGLEEAGQKIGEVIELITDIAAQTNLLALNATIEAARAGEAGKGFAVVATEVKSLATQTAKATEDIAAQIGEMQAATKSSVLAIDGIGKTIEEVSAIASGISAAVQEQGAATQEISRNVQQAADGTKEVTKNIGGVTEGAGETGKAAGQVTEAVHQLTTQSGSLKEAVEKYLTAVKAA